MSKFPDKFGPEYSKRRGYIIEPVSSSKYMHRFGGSSWSVVDTGSVEGGPALLFVLDLSDPRLSDLAVGPLIELPICSYINSDVWLHEQTYKFSGDTNEVLLISKNSTGAIILEDDDMMPNPLPEKAVSLREMKESEYPINEDSYWENTDDFLGGQSFFRVAGSPLWLQSPENVRCSCLSEMKFVMGIGYEGWDGPFQYFDETPFFLGEAGLYIYVCLDCSELKVISQPS